MSGGPPSTSSESGSSSNEPAISCHEMSVSIPTGGVHFFTSTKPRPETTTEPKAPSRPSPVTPSGVRSTSSVTPASPTTAARMRSTVARSPIRRKASAITASGDVACTVEASPPGRP